MRLKDQVPMRAHDAVAAQSHIEAIEAFAKNRFKRGKVTRFLKNTKPTVRTIQSVIDDVSFSYSLGPRHNRQV